MFRHLSFLLIINLIGFSIAVNNSSLIASHVDKSEAGMSAIPASKGINSLCLDEWSRHKELIIYKRDSLHDDVVEREKCSRNKEKIQQEIAILKERLSYLDKVIDLINILEKSDVEYILKPSDMTEGSTSYDAKRKCVVLTVGSTANFIHEITHGGQYEVGEIIFDSLLEKSYLQDLVDETEAYKAQFSYDPASVTALKSNTVARTLNDITSQWVENLQSQKGEKTYKEHGKIRVNIYSRKEMLLQAYPQLKNQFKDWAENYTMQQVPNMVYKRQPFLTSKW